MIFLNSEGNPDFAIDVISKVIVVFILAFLVMGLAAAIKFFWLYLF